MLKEFFVLKAEFCYWVV